MSTMFTNKQTKHDRQQYAQNAPQFSLEEDQDASASASKDMKTAPAQDSQSQAKSRKSDQKKVTAGKSYQFQLINDEEEENDYSQENYS